MRTLRILVCALALTGSSQAFATRIVRVTPKPTPVNPVAAAGAMHMLRFAFETGLGPQAAPQSLMTLPELHLKAMSARTQEHEVFSVLSKENQVKLAHIVREAEGPAGETAWMAKKEAASRAPPGKKSSGKQAQEREKAREVLQVMNSVLDGISLKDLSDKDSLHAATGALWDGLAAQARANASPQAGKTLQGDVSGRQRTGLLPSKESSTKTKLERKDVPKPEKKKRRLKLPIVTALLVAANVAAYYAPGMGWFETASWGQNPAHFAEAVASGSLGDIARQSANLVSYSFVHAGDNHIAFNMVGMALLGSAVESLFGHLKTAGVYFAAVLAASIGWMAVYWGADINSVGASGGVMGLAGLYIILHQTHLSKQKATSSLKGFFYFLLAWMAAIVGMGFIADLYGGFMQVAQYYGDYAWATADRTNHIAHLAGFMVGALAIPYWLMRLPAASKKV